MFGSRSRDAILSKPNDLVEFLVYGFVDQQTDLWIERDSKIISNLKSESNQLDRKYSSEIESETSEVSTGEPILLNVKNLNTYMKFGKPLQIQCTISKRLFIILVYSQNNSNIVFLFTFLDDPNAKVVWSIFEDSLSTDNLIMNRDNLIIKRLQKTNLGDYECSSHYQWVFTKLVYTLEQDTHQINQINGRMKSYTIESINSSYNNLPQLKIDFVTPLENIEENGRVEIKCSSTTSNFYIFEIGIAKIFFFF